MIKWSYPSLCRLTCHGKRPKRAGAAPALSLALSDGSHKGSGQPSLLYLTSSYTHTHRASSAVLSPWRLPPITSVFGINPESWTPVFCRSVLNLPAPSRAVHKHSVRAKGVLINLTFWKMSPFCCSYLVKLCLLTFPAQESMLSDCGLGGRGPRAVRSLACQSSSRAEPCPWHLRDAWEGKTFHGADGFH